MYYFTNQNLSFILKCCQCSVPIINVFYGSLVLNLQSFTIKNIQMIVESQPGDHFSRFDLSTENTLVKISATLLLIIIANFLKFILKEYISIGTPFLIYFAIVMACGRFIGFWYAVFCFMVCGIIAAIFFIIPEHGFGLTAIVQLFIYFIESLFIAVTASGFTKALTTVKINISNFKLLVSHSEDGIARISKEGKIFYISPAIEKITGLNKEELVAGGFNIFPEEKERKLVAESFLNVINQPGKSITIVHGYNNKSNQKKWMETIFTNHLNVKGLNAIVANFRDVTERVEADMKKNDFIGIAAHEIKNPLAVVMLKAELLENALLENNLEEAKEIITNFSRGTQKISQLLNELLDFSSFETMLKKMDFTEFDLHTIIEGSLFTFRAAYNNHVEVRGETRTKIFADQFRVEQLLVNLLTNAAKYSPPESIVTVTCSIEKEFIKIAVKDQGIGIPQSHLPFIFNKFHRVKNDRSRGFGLGLYICSEIVKAYNGEIGVQSEEGKGSVFWFTLPVNIKDVTN